MSDKDKRQKATRREFIELLAAGSVGATAAGLGAGSIVDRAQAETRTADRSRYKIFSPGRIGKLKLKNRIIRSAAYEGGGAPTGEVNDDMIRIHRAYAEGGVSLTISGYMAVMLYGKKGTHVCAYEDRFIPGLKKLADAVHKVGNDCKIAAEIGHDGTSVPGKRNGKVDRPPLTSPTGATWPERIGPSGINWQGEKEGHVMTEAEIERFCDDMGHAARRLREAGFDAVEIHGAHHYLIDTFLSPFTNRRTDRYGGSLKNRVRIVAETVKRMREHVGRDFPILIKLNCDDGPTHNGIAGETDIHTFPALTREIVRAGVDAIDISGSQRPGDPLRMDISDPKAQSFYQQFAEALDVNVPVILGCGNRNVELLEKILSTGKVDFFCFARPMVREPDLAKRWLEGRGGAASECINSNLCFRELFVTGGPARCVVLAEMQKSAEVVLKANKAGYGV
jgi:2,4-dienoyl-CoA reductase-like NADH-dependent reductase (Old Yellow Enzyme family)